MEKSSFESVCDFAISKFKESFNEAENEYNLMESYNFPHWKEITQKVHSVWQKNYSDKLKIYNDNNQIDNLFNAFRSYMTKIMQKRADYSQLKKYIEFVIDFRINQIRNESLEEQMEQKENLNDQITSKLTLKPIVKLDPLSMKPAKNTTTDVKKTALLKKIYHYEIDKLLRAHSKDNNITDSSTIVTDVAYELAPDHQFGHFNNLPSYTNYCATCGHNIINVLDTESGKIVKRFNDDLLMNKNKESFNCLAWTYLNNNVSVLAGAGDHGQIKIIVPKYSTCFVRIDAHSSPITSLLFHYKYSNILFSASDDNTIKIWKLHLKEGSSDLDSECSNELLNTIQIGDGKSKNSKETIFSMCFVPNDFLLISTRNSIYSIKLSDDVLFNLNTNQPMEIQRENLSNEDAIEFMTSKPKEKENLRAKPVKMYGISSQNMIYEELIITNQLVYYKDLLFANLLNSTFVYIIELSVELNEANEENMILKVVSNIKVGEEKSTDINKMSLYKDDMIVYIIKSSSAGGFYFLSLDESLKGFSTMQRYTIPTDYTIKPYSDPGKKTNIKNYGLMENPSVVNAVCNGTRIVSVTNQNMIVTWKKLRVIGED